MACQGMAVRAPIFPMPTFRHPHRVVYSECTLGNHIYYARFLDLFEEARGELFRAMGTPFLALQEAGLILPVLEADVRYARAVRYDELVHVEVTPSILGKVRLEFAYRVLGPGDDVRVTGRTLHVATNLQDRPQRLPADLVAALAPWLRPDGTTAGNADPKPTPAPAGA